MNPSSSSAGRSFAECTARSISPDSSASRIVSIHSPLRPCGAVRGGGAFVAGGGHRHELDLDAVRFEVGADLFGLGDRERRAARADPHAAHVASGSIPSSSARTRAWTPSVPGSERSFSSTMGSCSSFAAIPRASASTAARSSGVRSRRWDAWRSSSPLDDLVAAAAERLDQRSERVAAAANHVPTDLLGDDLVRAHDVLGGVLVALGEVVAHAPRRRSRSAPSRWRSAGSMSRGTARSSRTRGRPPRARIAVAAASREMITCRRRRWRSRPGRRRPARRGARRGRRAGRSFARPRPARAPGNG